MANGNNIPQGELAGYQFGTPIQRPDVNGGLESDNFVAKTIRERWWLLAIFAVLSAAIAYAVSGQFRVQTVKASTTLIFDGLPSSSVGGNLYAAQSIATYAKLFTSLEQIQGLKEEFGLAGTPKAIERQLAVKVFPRSNLMEIENIGGDAEQAVEVLNAAVQNFIESVAARRAAAIDKKLRHVETNLLEATSRLERAQRAFDAKAELTDDSDTEQAEMLKESINRLASALDQRNATVAARSFQLEQLLAKQQETMVLVKDLTLTRAIEGITKAQDQYARSSERFQELADKRKKMQEACAEADVHNLLDWQRVVREICGDRFSAALFRSAELVSLGGKLTKLSDAADAAPWDVELMNKEIEQLSGKLEQYRSEHDEVVQNAAIDLPTESELAELKVNLDTAQRRKDRLEDRRSGLEELKAPSLREFSVVTRASEAACELDSNRNKVFAMTCMAGCVILTFPLFATRWVRSLPSQVEQLSSKLGIALVASGEARRGIRNRRNAEIRADESDSQTLRKLAMRIKQTASETGAIVLFAGSSDDGSQIRASGPLASYLTQRETSVLIVDVAGSLSDAEQSGVVGLLPSSRDSVSGGMAQTNEFPHQGVTDFVSGECDDFERMILPTHYVGVDFIAHGGQPLEIGGPRAHRLLSQARRKYNVILVTGPSLEHSVDLQCLAADADAIVLAFDEKERLAKGVCEAVEELSEIEIPIIAFVA